MSWSKIRYFCIIYAVGNINVFQYVCFKGNDFEWLRMISITYFGYVMILKFLWIKIYDIFMWFYVIEPFKFFSMRWTVLKCPKNSQSDGKFWNFLVRKTILGRIGVASERGSLIRNVSREHFVEHAVFNSIPFLF